MQIGYDAARGLGAKKRWPQGVMCVSDQIAYGAHRFARESGIAIPEDSVLVSIDGNALNAWLAPWLTSVTVPHRDYGQQIVELLTTLWGGGEAAERILAHRLA
jgi:LacI family transcriptional regulator